MKTYDAPCEAFRESMLTVVSLGDAVGSRVAPHVRARG